MEVAAHPKRSSAASYDSGHFFFVSPYVPCGLTVTSQNISMYILLGEVSVRAAVGILRLWSVEEL